MAVWNRVDRVADLDSGGDLEGVAAGTPAPTCLGGAHVSASDMVTYIVLVNALGAHDWVTVGNQIDDRLQSGDITYDLTKPVGFPVLVLGRSLGEDFLETSDPNTTGGGDCPPGLGTYSAGELDGGPCALATVLIGKSVAFAIGYLLGCLSFWMLSSWHYQWVVGAITKVLSGFVVPLWFMPDWLWLAPRLLPFSSSGLHSGGTIPRQDNRRRRPGCFLAWASHGRPCFGLRWCMHGGQPSTEWLSKEADHRIHAQPAGVQ